MSKVSICVLTYGDYPELARRAVESIRQHGTHEQYQLIVGANAAGRETLGYLERLASQGGIDDLIVSPENLNKNPMMARMFERVEGGLVWWFDDDSWIREADAMARWCSAVASAPARVVQWGCQAMCDYAGAFTELEDPVGFVRGADWYRGLPPPSWRLGGKGEMNFAGLGAGDGRWFFIVGGCWMMRTSAIRALGWPDPRLVKNGDDVFLGEAIRQQGWAYEDIGTPGVAMDTEPRRGVEGFVKGEGELEWRRVGQETGMITGCYSGEIGPGLNLESKAGTVV